MNPTVESASKLFSTPEKLVRTGFKEISSKLNKNANSNDKSLLKTSASMDLDLGGVTSWSSAAKDLKLSEEELRAPAVRRAGTPASSTAGARDPGPDGEAARFPSDPLVDDEILASMDEEYYQTGFDASKHELKKLPGVLDQSVIHGDRQRLLAQLTVVTKRVFAGILEKQSACLKEMERVEELQARLKNSVDICRDSRKGLSNARQGFTSSSLGILAAYRRRTNALATLHDLDIILTLQKTDERLSELLSEEENDLCGAVKLILQAKKVATDYRRFASVRGLASRLNDALDMVEERLDGALARACLDFSPKIYASTQESYHLLGKSVAAMDQLHMHVASAVHNTAWNVVYGHAVLTQQFAEADLAKKPYADLCCCLAVSSVLPCLVDLCRALWGIMDSYRKITIWHKEEAEKQVQDLPEDDLSLDSKLSRQFMKKKLEAGQSRVWQDVQAKAKILVASNDLSQLGMDSFIEFMDVIHKLIEVGHSFCGSDSDTLQESLKTQCLAYFQSYHQSSLEELKMHLENEGWQPCPVKPSFGVHKLAEFRHLHRPATTMSPLKAPGSAMSSTSVQVSPFDTTYDGDDGDDDVFVDNADRNNLDQNSLDSSSEEEELKEDFVDEDKDHTNYSQRHINSAKLHKSPVLTTASLTLLRLTGKYLRLMRALKPVAPEILASVMQLLDFYMLVVHDTFTTDLSLEHRSRVTKKELSDLLASIREAHGANDNDAPLRFNQLSRHPSGLNATELPEKLYGLSERVAAVESVVYLAKQFKDIFADLNTFLPEDDIAIMLRNKLSLVPYLRRPVYLPVAINSIQRDSVLQLMSRVAWDIKEVSTQHSQYVEVLLRDFQLFSMNLQSVRRSIHLSSEVRQVLWDLCTLVASHIFVEGFASAKRCSNEGRALMQLDYRQFVVKLDKMSEARPVPYQEFVTGYVKAFYIPEVDLEAWVDAHKEEYTARQLESLVNSVAYSNNRTKQKLNNIISRIRR